MNTDLIPDFFLCPITGDVMEYPFSTEQGYSYEYSAIISHFKNANTDPMTNIPMKSKLLIPNHNLRSQIIDWFQENKALAHLRNIDAQKPPVEAYQVRVNGLDQVLQYHGKRSKQLSNKTEGKDKSQKDKFQKDKAQRDKAQKDKPQKEKSQKKLPKNFTVFGHTYSFSWSKGNDNKPLVMIKCDDGSPIEMVDHSVFATPMGLLFYNAKELCDARVLPETDFIQQCKFENGCTRDDCSYAHPFVCVKGISCPKKKNGCKFYHPPESSVNPVNDEVRVCKYNTSCTRPKCYFAHPNGRMTIQRVKARIFITHSPTLEEFVTPIPVEFDLPESATCFQIQGEFICSFQPFSGPWAKQYLKEVTVHRFDQKSMSYKSIGKNYSLDGHYCNCAVVKGRYMIFSFWPYEGEAMRTIWECSKVTRTLEKELKEKDMEIQTLKIENQSLKTENLSLREHIQTVRQELQRVQYQLDNAQKQKQNLQKKLSIARKVARVEAIKARKEARKAEKAYEILRKNQEAKRTERLRLRDPIHIYALQDDKSGECSDDWKLIVDFHKGAHRIELGRPRPDRSQQVNFIVHDECFQFELLDPRRIASSNVQLPLKPSLLCPEF